MAGLAVQGSTSPESPISDQGVALLPRVILTAQPRAMGHPLYHPERNLMSSFKKFKYVISFYTRDEIDSNPPTQRVATEYRVEASTATRAITAFKKLPQAKGAAIISVVADNENGRYDTGPSTVLRASHASPELNTEPGQ